jgi:hypothetical protein
MSRPLLFIGLAAAALTLSACGKVGQLERPGPLYGSGRTTREADEAEHHAQDPSRPVNTVNPRDINSDPAPPRAAPIAGINNPMGSQQPGALPDPYTNPR